MYCAPNGCKRSLFKGQSLVLRNVQYAILLRALLHLIDGGGAFSFKEKALIKSAGRNCTLIINVLLTNSLLLTGGPGGP